MISGRENDPISTQKINHVGVAVRDPEVVLDLLQSLGGQVQSSTTIEAYGLTSTIVAVGGLLVELVELHQPAEQAAALAGADARLHHVALGVEDLRATMQRLAAVGVRFQGPNGGEQIVEPIDTPTALHAWTAPNTTAGLMLQLTETTSGVEST